MYTKSLALLTFIFFCTKTICKKYDNYTLYRVMPVSKKDLEFFETVSKGFQINFWRPPSTVYRPVEFVLAPEYQKKFIADAKKRDLYVTTVIKNLQSAFDRQTVKSYIRRNMESYDWKSYFRLTDMYSWIKDLSIQHPQELTMFSIGNTFESRKIYAVRIILKGSKRRSRVIIEGGIHAREWIAPAFVTYMINEILNAPKKRNNEMLEIAKTYEWYFVPVLNPDGYEYSHTQDRLWRKNRFRGYGVDINRNFDAGFGTVGVSSGKFEEIYCGPSPFSENESLAMAKFVESLSDKLEYYIGFHSYGQFMIIPYAHSTTHQDNYDEVYSMGRQAAKNISRRYGTKYTVGTAYDTVGYRTSGVSGCWVKKTFRVPYVLMFELRDHGHDGFALPPKKIIPTCQETMEGLVSFLTPRTKLFQKLEPLEKRIPLTNDQKNKILDGFVVVCNVLLFIIVRFD